MPGAIATIVNAISAEVIASLAAAGLPPLVDGKILVGPQHLAEHSSPPRVVFVPVTNTLAPKNTMNPITVGDTTVKRAINAQRTLFSEWLTFEVHVWGAASPPDADAGDYDATRTLYQAVWQAIAHNLGVPSFGGESGIVKMSTVEWNDDEGQATGLGREAVFSFAVSTPVLDTQLLYPTPDVTRTMNLVLSPGDDPPTPVT